MSRHVILCVFIYLLAKLLLHYSKQHPSYSDTKQRNNTSQEKEKENMPKYLLNLIYMHDCK